MKNLKSFLIASLLILLTCILIGVKPSKSKTIENKATTIEDQIKFKDSLTIGKKYTIKGTVRNKEDGNPVIMNSEPVTTKLTFIANEKHPIKSIVFKGTEN